MKKIDNRHYCAEEGKILVRISDNLIMGTGIDLGNNDSIENYREEEMPENYTEEKESFLKKINNEQVNRKPRV